METNTESIASTLDPGSLVEGTVTGITSFGAFIKLPTGREGLVHISEIANEYVTDIHHYVTLGEKVTVKILGVNKQNKFDLSLKQAGAVEKKPSDSDGPSRDDSGGGGRPPRADRFDSSDRGDRGSFKPRKPKLDISPGSDNFEDRVSSFLKKSDEKQIDIKRNIQTKQGIKKRKRR